MSDDLEWTTERPTKPGIYWAYEALDPRTADVMLLEVTEKYYSIYEEIPDKRELQCFSCGGEQIHHMKDFSHWMGPIEVPKPPEVTT